MVFITPDDRRAVVVGKDINRVLIAYNLKTNTKLPEGFWRTPEWKDIKFLGQNGWSVYSSLHLGQSP